MKPKVEKSISHTLFLAYSRQRTLEAKFKIDFFTTCSCQYHCNQILLIYLPGSAVIPVLDCTDFFKRLGPYEASC